jgi:hypothetical protein
VPIVASLDELKTNLLLLELIRTTCEVSLNPGAMTGLLPVTPRDGVK